MNKKILKSMKQLFRGGKEISTVEEKYIEKYSNLIDWDTLVQIFAKYNADKKSSIPPRHLLTEQEQEHIYDKIDNEASFTSREKFVTIIGMMFLLDGYYPNKAIMSRITIVFGRKFTQDINKTHEDFIKLLEYHLKQTAQEDDPPNVARS